MIEVNNLFDTQIAASFLGLQETGLAALLKNILGVDIDKKYSKKKLVKTASSRPCWPTRFMTPVISWSLAAYLKGNCKIKKGSYGSRRRCRSSRVRFFPPDDNPLFMKFKNARRLRFRELAILRIDPKSERRPGQKK